MINIFSTTNEKQSMLGFAPMLNMTNSVYYKATKFPGGEINVVLETNDRIKDRDISIEADLKTMDDVMTLLLLTDAIKRQFPNSIDLVMPYVPYARQDRNMQEGDALSIKVFADLINAQGYRSVTVWDAHSDVAPALINNCINVPQYKLLDKNLELDIVSSHPVLVIPDAGAVKKVLKFAEYHKITDIAQGEKHRDVITGKIIGTTFKSKQMYATKEHWILDDICDGGATFIHLAKAIREFYDDADNKVKINLLVTHGIFSKGKEVLFGHGLIDRVEAISDWTKF